MTLDFFRRNYSRKNFIGHDCNNLKLNILNKKKTCNEDFHLLPYRSCSKTHSTIIICPICNFENRIPVKGVQDLPPHYILQHRMLVNSLNRSGICLLCDLCSQETPVRILIVSG